MKNQVETADLQGTECRYIPLPQLSQEDFEDHRIGWLDPKAVPTANCFHAKGVVVTSVNISGSGRNWVDSWG